MIKQIFLLSLLLWTIPNLTAQTKSGKLLASCCETAGRGCNGSDYCTVCTNCSGCKHCKSGGTCSVCSDRSADKGKKKTPTDTKVKSVAATKKIEFYKDQPLFITAESILLYKGPGTKYKKIESVKKGKRVIVMKVNEPWLKVKSEKTGTVGYVHRDVLQ